MADVVLNVSANPIQLQGSITSIKKDIRSLEGLLGSSIISPQEQQKILVRIGDLKGELQDLRKATQLTDTKDVFGNLATLVGVANTAVVGLTASLEVFGYKGEELNQIQAKLNKIMQIGIVIQQLADSNRLKGLVLTYSAKIKEFVINNLLIKQKQTELGATIALTAAQRAYNAALIASGIGAVIALLGLLVSWLLKSSDATDTATTSSKEYKEKQDELKKSIDENNKSIQDNIDKIKVLQGLYDSDEIKKRRAIESNKELNDELKRLQATLDLSTNAPTQFAGQFFLTDQQKLDIEKQLTDLRKLISDNEVIIAEADKNAKDKRIEAQKKLNEKLVAKELETTNILLKDLQIRYEDGRLSAIEYFDKLDNLYQDGKINLDLWVQQLERLKINPFKLELSDEQITRFSPLNRLKKLDEELIQKNNELKKSLGENSSEVLKDLLIYFETGKESTIDNWKNLKEIYQKNRKEYNDIISKYNSIDIEEQKLFIESIYQLQLKAAGDDDKLKQKATDDRNKSLFELEKYNILVTDGFKNQIDQRIKILEAGIDIQSAVSSGLLTINGDLSRSAALYVSKGGNILDFYKKLSELITDLKNSASAGGFDLQQFIEKLKVSGIISDTEIDKISKVVELQKQISENPTDQSLFVEREALLSSMNYITYELLRNTLKLINLPLPEAGEKVKTLAQQFKELEQQVIATFGDVPLTALDIYTQRLTENFDLLNHYLDQNYDKQVSQIDKLKEYGLISDQEAIDRKKAAEEKYNEEKLKQKQREFIYNKKAALAEIAINTAVAITQALSDGRYALAILAGVQGALQASVVAAQNTPQYKDGGITGLLNGPSHEQGGIMTNVGELEGGEYIINKQSTLQNIPTLNAINGNNDLITNLNNKLDVLINLTANQKLVVPVESINKVQNDLVKIKERAYV